MRGKDPLKPVPLVVAVFDTDEDSSVVDGVRFDEPLSVFIITW